MKEEALAEADKMVRLTREVTLHVHHLIEIECYGVAARSIRSMIAEGAKMLVIIENEEKNKCPV